MRDAASQPPDFKTHQPKIIEKEQEQRTVADANPDKTLSPLGYPDQLRASRALAFRQQIQFNRSRRCLDPDEFGAAGQNTLDGIAQLMTALVQQHVWKRGVDSL